MAVITLNTTQEVNEAMKVITITLQQANTIDALNQLQITITNNEYGGSCAVQFLGALNNHLITCIDAIDINNPHRAALENLRQAVVTQFFHVADAWSYLRMLIAEYPIISLLLLLSSVFAVAGVAAYLGGFSLPSANTPRLPGDNSNHDADPHGGVNDLQLWDSHHPTLDPHGSKDTRDSVNANTGANAPIIPATVAHPSTSSTTIPKYGEDLFVTLVINVAVLETSIEPLSDMLSQTTDGLPSILFKHTIDGPFISNVYAAALAQQGKNNYELFTLLVKFSSAQQLNQPLQFFNSDSYADTKVTVLAWAIAKDNPIVAKIILDRASMLGPKALSDIMHGVSHAVSSSGTKMTIYNRYIMDGNLAMLELITSYAPTIAELNIAHSPSSDALDLCMMHPDADKLIVPFLERAKALEEVTGEKVCSQLLRGFTGSETEVMRLIIPLYNNNHQLFKVILEYATVEDLLTQDNFGVSLFQRAAQRENLQAVRIIIARAQKLDCMSQLIEEKNLFYLAMLSQVDVQPGKISQIQQSILIELVKIADLEHLLYGHSYFSDNVHTSFFHKVIELGDVNLTEAILHRANELGSHSLNSLYNATPETEDRVFNHCAKDPVALNQIMVLLTQYGFKPHKNSRLRQVDSPTGEITWQLREKSSKISSSDTPSANALVRRARWEPPKTLDHGEAYTPSPKKVLQVKAFSAAFERIAITNSLDELRLLLENDGDDGLPAVYYHTNESGESPGVFYFLALSPLLENGFDLFKLLIEYSSAAQLTQLYSLPIYSGATQTISLLSSTLIPNENFNIKAAECILKRAQSLGDDVVSEIMQKLPYWLNTDSGFYLATPYHLAIGMKNEDTIKVLNLLTSYASHIDELAPLSHEEINAFIFAAFQPHAHLNVVPFLERAKELGCVSELLQLTSPQKMTGVHDMLCGVTAIERAVFVGDHKLLSVLLSDSELVHLPDSLLQKAKRAGDTHVYELISARIAYLNEINPSFSWKQILLQLGLSVLGIGAAGYVINGLTKRNVPMQHNRVQPRAPHTNPPEPKKRTPSSSSSASSSAPRLAPLLVTWGELLQTNISVLAGNKETSKTVTFTSIFAFIDRFRDDQNRFDKAAVEEAIHHHTQAKIPEEIAKILTTLEILASTIILPLDDATLVTATEQALIDSIKKQCATTTGYQTFIDVINTERFLPPTTLLALKNSNLLIAMPHSPKFSTLSFHSIIGFINNYVDNKGCFDVIALGESMRNLGESISSAQTKDILSALTSLAKDILSLTSEEIFFESTTTASIKWLQKLCLMPNFDAVVFNKLISSKPAPRTLAELNTSLLNITLEHGKRPQTITFAQLFTWIDDYRDNGHFNREKLVSAFANRTLKKASPQLMAIISAVDVLAGVIRNHDHAAEAAFSIPLKQAVETLKQTCSVTNPDGSTLIELITASQAMTDARHLEVSSPSVTTLTPSRGKHGYHGNGKGKGSSGRRKGKPENDELAKPESDTYTSSSLSESSAIPSDSLSMTAAQAVDRYQSFFHEPPQKRRSKSARTVSASSDEPVMTLEDASWRVFLMSVFEHLGKKASAVTPWLEGRKANIITQRSFMYQIFRVIQALTDKNCKEYFTNTPDDLRKTAWALRNIICHAMRDVSIEYLDELYTILTTSLIGELNFKLSASLAYRNLSGKVSHQYAITSSLVSQHLHANTSSNEINLEKVNQSVHYMKSHLIDLFQWTKANLDMTQDVVRAICMHTIAIRECLREPGVDGAIKSVDKKLAAVIHTFLVELREQANVTAHDLGGMPFNDARIRTLVRPFFRQIPGILSVINVYLQRVGALSSEDATAEAADMAQSVSQSSVEGLARPSSSSS